MKKVIKQTATLSKDQMNKVKGGGGHALANFVKVKATEIAEVATPSVIS